MKVSEAILKYLTKNGVKCAFGIPSGTVSYIIDSMNDIKDIEYIVTKNEAAASFSACKYAKISGKLGLCIMSGSVGVANAMNGIAEAAQCNAPILILSGYINQNQKGLGLMHDVESSSYLNGIVKHSHIVCNEKEVIKELKRAMEIAMTHPRGPVNIEIPVNIQNQEFTGAYLEYQEPRELAYDFENLNKAIKLIESIDEGLIIVGGACRGMGSSILELAAKLSWRIVTTHSAKAVIDEDFRLSMGHFGFPGTDIAIDYINNGSYKCVLVLGSDLGEMATANFNPNLGKAKLIHIHTNRYMFNRAYKADIAIENNIQFAIDYLKEKVKCKLRDNNVKVSLNKPYCQNHSGFSLRLFYENIHRYLPQDTFYINDVGESVAFVNKYLKIPKEGDYECNINYGCMGNSVGAIGISRIDTNRQIAVFVGDGSFYMNLMAEVLTAKKYKMKIIFFVINNSALGYVSRGLQAMFGRALDDFKDEYTDITKIVQAMDVPAMKIREFVEMERLKSFIKDINSPQVVEIITDGTEPLPLNRGKIIANRN